jgi:uncharacterized protein YndB with AHSA1/START domain
MRKIIGVIILSGLIFCACKNKTNNDSGQKKQNDEMETLGLENQNREDAFVISHTFDNDIKTLFNMWITPETYTSWMGPAGADMSFLRADIKEGGSALWQMTTPDGLTKYGKLHYKTINPNVELVYVQYFCDKAGNFIKAPFSATYPDSLLLSVNFVQDLENKVLMTVKWEIFGESKEIERKTFNDMKPLMEKGWRESFSKIETLLK